MNIYSVLDSDEDEKPTTKPVKTQVAASNDKANVSSKADNKPQGGNNKAGNNKAAPAANSADFEAPPERASKGPNSKHHHSKHGAKDHHHPEGGAAPRKRQFDRRSGTGRGKEVSKDGAGGANWGSDKLEALKGEKHVAGDAADIIAEENVEETEENAVAEPEEPPAPVVFTLDEYNKRRAEARVQSEAFVEVKIREVSADFSGMKTKEDTEEDFLVLGSSKKEKAKKGQRSTAKNVVLDVAFTTAPTEQPERPPRNDRDRNGGRGGGRGGDRSEGRGDRPRSGRGGDRPRSSGKPEGRGGDRSGPRPGPRGPKVDFNDSSAFPSLS